jgi:DNA-binding NarL/FixJ family response regulator
LVVTCQPERIYAERALRAGAAGYWTKNGSVEELLHALDTVAAGEGYISPAINALAIQKFAHRETLPRDITLLTGRKLAIFALIAAEERVDRIAEKVRH